jgi:hypothetical protein
VGTPRIHAISKPAHIPNPVIRLGFRVFGHAATVRPAPPRSGQLTVAPATTNQEPATAGAGKGSVLKPLSEDSRTGAG